MTHMLLYHPECMTSMTMHDHIPIATDQRYAMTAPLLY
jgi:hypothetical protein